MLRTFLGVEVISTSNGLFLSLNTNTLWEVPTNLHIAGAKDVFIIMNSFCLLTLLDSSPPVDSEMFQKIIGQLQYLLVTRAAISFAIDKLLSIHVPVRETQ